MINKRLLILEASRETSFVKVYIAHFLNNIPNIRHIIFFSRWSETEQIYIKIFTLYSGV